MNLSLLVLLVGVIACTFTNRWNGVLASAKTVPQVLHLDLWPRLWGELRDRVTLFQQKLPKLAVQKICHYLV